MENQLLLDIKELKEAIHGPPKRRTYRYFFICCSALVDREDSEEIPRPNKTVKLEISTKATKNKPEGS